MAEGYVSIDISKISPFYRNEVIKELEKEKEDISNCYNEILQNKYEEKCHRPGRRWYAPWIKYEYIMTYDEFYGNMMSYGFNFMWLTQSHFDVQTSKINQLIKLMKSTVTDNNNKVLTNTILVSPSYIHTFLN